MTWTSLIAYNAITMEVEFSYYEDFFHVALDTYKEIVKTQSEHDKLQRTITRPKKRTVSDDITDMLAEKNDRIGRLSLIVIIFCATSLEAYINHYAISRQSKNYFKAYLDKLDLLSKWVIIPGITTGVQLDAGSKALQDLSSLITLRNKLVHPKSRKVEIAKIKVSDFLWEEDARRAIETVKNVVKELSKIDKEIDSKWTVKKYEKYPFFE